MSITKTKCPPLSDLSESISPSDGLDSKRSSKPLCDNIFDVQRSELVEVLERLRTAFWSDAITLPTLITPQLQTPQLQTPLQTLKRSLSEPDEDTSYQNTEIVPKLIAKKRARLNTPQAEEVAVKKSPSTPITPPSPKSLQSFASLWPLKKSILRQIKTTNRYKESQLLTVLTDIYQTKSTEQTRHLAAYFIPVAKAMRRDTIVKLLEQWLL
ncbi:hypothetical protein HPULCUR_011446 [Helicostylum pulchrum]|uniref:Uncharacterized protein n=1 Tax=Helicostylum pulchrum TaxID=562976 RepID=A0ABP9YG44_9FUNG